MKKLLTMTAVILLTTNVFADSFSRVSIETGPGVAMKIQDDVAQKMFESLTQVKETTFSGGQGDVITSRGASTVDCAKIKHTVTGFATDYVCLLSMKEDGAFMNPLITTTGDYKN